jgi:hypothetical protein
LSAAGQKDTEANPSRQAADGWLCELTLDERAPVNDPEMLQSATQQEQEKVKNRCQVPADFRK